MNLDLTPQDQYADDTPTLPLAKGTILNTSADTPKRRRVIKRYSNRKLYDTRDSVYVTLLDVAKMVRAGDDVRIIDNATKEDKTEVTLAMAISEELRAKHRSVPRGTLRNLLQEWGGTKLLASLREGPIRRLIPGEPLDASDGIEPLEGQSAADSAEVSDSEVADANLLRCATESQPGVEVKQPQGSQEQEKSDDLEHSRVPNEPEPLQQTAVGKRQAQHQHNGKTTSEENKASKQKRERASLAEIVASSRHTLDQWQHAIDDRVRAVLPSVALLLDIQAEVRRLSARVQRLERELQLEHLGQNQPAPNHPDRADLMVESTEQSTEPTHSASKLSTCPSAASSPATEPSTGSCSPGTSETVKN